MPYSKVFFTTFFLLICLVQGRAQELDYRYRDAALPVQQRIDILLSQMTLEEKVGQLRQCNLSSEVLEGEFEIMVGNSSEHILLREKILVN